MKREKAQNDAQENVKVWIERGNGVKVRRNVPMVGAGTGRCRGASEKKERFGSRAVIRSPRAWFAG
jgi:hypothetical protein